jgi:hypothetical protein
MNRRSSFRPWRRPLASLAALTLGLASLMVAAAGPAGAAVPLCSDVTGPQLTALGRTPAAVNVVAANGNVTVTAHATDDISGVASILVVFTPVSGNGDAVAVLHRTAGTGLSGDWSGMTTIRRWSVNGAWRIDNVELQDRVGNFTFLTTAQLIAKSFPTTLTVTSKQDTIKPTAGSLTFKPRKVDTRTGKKTVRVTATLKDKGGSGVAGAFATFSRTTKAGNYGGGAFLRKVKGTTSTYSGTATVPVHADAVSPATWRLTFNVFDGAGNTTTYSSAALAAHHWPTSLNIVTKPDKAPPVLKSVTVSPATVDVSAAPGAIKATATVTDNLSGTRFVDVTFQPTAGFGYVNGFLMLKSGTSRNGTWVGTVHVPLCQAAGTYVISGADTSDLTGNSRSYTATQLAAAGIKAKFTVTG